MKNITTYPIQSQGAEGNCRSAFSGLAADAVVGVAVDSESETEVRSRNRDRCFTAHAGLGLTVRIPCTQSHRMLLLTSYRSRHNGNGMKHSI
jgi:hypothetical protein